jgi:urea transport system permease protein
MSGGVTVLGSLVLSYNRIVIVFFALFVVFAVWLI